MQTVRARRKGTTLAELLAALVVFSVVAFSAGELFQKTLLSKKMAYAEEDLRFSMAAAQDALIPRIRGASSIDRIFSDRITVTYAGVQSTYCLDGPQDGTPRTLMKIPGGLCDLANPGRRVVEGTRGAVTQFVVSTTTVDALFSSMQSLYDNNPFINPGNGCTDAANTNLTLNSNSNTTLPPGNYGRLAMGNNVTLTLQSGNYQFNSIGINTGNDFVVNLSLNANQDPVVIYVTGSLEIGNNARVNNVLRDPSKLLVIVGDCKQPTGQSVQYGNGAIVYWRLYAPGALSVEFGNNVVFADYIFAPRASVEFGNNVAINGSITGNNIEIGNNAVVTGNLVANKVEIGNNAQVNNNGQGLSGVNFIFLRMNLLKDGRPFSIRYSIRRRS